LIFIFIDDMPRCDTGIAAGITDRQAQLTTQKNTTQQKPKLVASNITEKKIL
jgi:hypothetical protein